MNTGINTVLKERGPLVTVHSGITATATSVNQECKKHNAIILFADFTAGSGTWTIKVQGRMPGTTTYIDMYDTAGNLMGLSSITADKAQAFLGVPQEFKIVATKDGGSATISGAYQLITL